MKRADKKSLSGALAVVSNLEVVTLALAKLGGATKRVHTEEIAEKALELAPSKFSWRLDKYKERGWPQIFVVKNALEDAQKPGNGGYVRGRCTTNLGKDGWSLTAAGATWVRERGELQNCSEPIEPILSKADRHRIQNRLSKIRVSTIYRRFSEEESLESASVYAFADLLNSNPAASKIVLQSKFNALQAQAALIDDQLMVRFFQACAERFGLMLENGE